MYIYVRYVCIYEICRCANDSTFSDTYMYTRISSMSWPGGHSGSGFGSGSASGSGTINLIPPMSVCMSKSVSMSEPMPMPMSVAYCA
jgi:hypothetical protein